MADEKTTEKRPRLQYMSHIIENQEMKRKVSNREAWELFQTNH